MYYTIWYTPLLCIGSFSSIYADTSTPRLNTATKNKLRYFQFRVDIFTGGQYSISHTSCWFFQMTHVNFDACINFNSFTIHLFTRTVSGNAFPTYDILSSMLTFHRYELNLKGGIQLLTVPHFPFRLNRKCSPINNNNVSYRQRRETKNPATARTRTQTQ